MVKKFFAKYKVPLAIFIGSRVAIVLVLMLAAGNGLDVDINRWDSVNYLSISQRGYQFSGDYTTDTGKLIAFFPLYPLLVRCMHFLTGMPFLVAGLLLSFVFSLGSVVFLYKHIREWKGEEAARMGVVVLSFFPTSFFFTAAYTESLFLFLTLHTLWFWKVGREKLSVFMVALSVVTRMTGSVLGLLYLWAVWKRTRSILKVLVLGFLAGIPFYAFLYFQYRHYGTPFAFMEAQHAAWQQHGVWPWTGLYLVFSRAFFNADFSAMWRIDFLYLVFAIGTLVASFKKIPRDIWLFGLGVVLLTLSSDRILGMGRYMLMVLPIYYYWGDLLSRKRALGHGVVPLLASLMGVTAVLFALSANVF